MRKHRTQLLLERDQYEWLKRRAGSERSISSIVRELIEAVRESERGSLRDDSFIRYLLDEPPAEGLHGPSTVTTLDEDLYGNAQDEDRGEK